MNDHVRSEDLAAYVDGRLSAALKSDLERHFSSCPACLDELADIAAVMGSREKVPSRFLEQALGQKSRTTRPALPLRLVFEVAAAVMVVVFIGYFFLGGNRSWQAPGQEKPSGIMDEKARHPDGKSVAHGGEPAPPASPQEKGDAGGRSLADALASGKRNSAAADKDVPGQAAAAANPLRKELLPNATEPEAFSDVPMEFSEKNAPATQATPAKGTALEQKLERQQDPGSGAALSRMAEAKETRLNEEASAMKTAAPVPADPGTERPEDAKKMRDAVMKQKGSADMESLSPLHFEGDVGWPDLQNPELVVSWTWFRPGLALEMLIDAAGAVTAASTRGTADPALVKLGEAEARKLLFSASKKKARRARLVAKDVPPSPAELQSPRQGG